LSPVIKEDVIVPAATGFFLLLITGTVAQPQSPVIIIRDTLCACSSSHGTRFQCRTFSNYIAKVRHTGSVHDNLSLKNIVRRYLDSTGYHTAVWDSSSVDSTIIHIGERSIVRNEQIRYHSFPSDTTLQSPQADISYPYPFDAETVKIRAREIGRYFTERGYPFVTLSTEIISDSASDSISVRYSIFTEKQYRFAPPALRGKITTRKNILLRDISIRPDSLFDSRTLSLSLERLQSRSYIAEAALLPPEVISTDSPEKERVIIPFMVSDRSGLGLDGAAGLEINDNEDPQVHGSIRFFFNNLFHRGEEAQLSYIGDRTRQRLDLGFMFPWPFSLPFILQGEGGLEVQSEDYGYISGELGVFAEPGPRWRAGITATTASTTSNLPENDSRYSGVDLVLRHQPRPFRDGMISRELTIRTGSGFSRKERVYNRSHIDFTVGGHVPAFTHQAVVLRAVSGHLISREDSFVPAELYRVGGNRSLRGYTEDAFAFRSVLYGQIEYLYYFRPRASVYIFSDGGAGFEHDLSFDNRDRTTMLGYGLGVRLPARNGTLSVAWARSIDDYRNFGRVHVRYQSHLAAITGSSFSFTGK
jgi:outer membrane protein assembly factor BamA